MSTNLGLGLVISFVEFDTFLRAWVSLAPGAELGLAWLGLAWLSTWC